MVTTTEGQTGQIQSGIFKPTLNDDGTPANILTAENETSADAKTMQYLINLGTPVEEAKRLVLENKNSDPSVIGASIFNNIMDVSRKNMGNPTPDDITNQVTAAVGHTRRAMKNLGLNPDDWNPAETAPAQPETPSSATEPAATKPAAAAPSRPKGVSDEALIQQADAGVKAGTLTRQAAKQRLKDWKVDSAKAADAGF